MLKWVDYNPPCKNKQLNVASAIVDNTDTITDMLQKQQKMLEKEQQQINTLTQTLEKIQQPRTENRPMRGFGRGRGSGRPSQVLCYACKVQGHFASECANYRNEHSHFNKEYRRPHQQPGPKFPSDPKVKPSQ